MDDRQEIAAMELAQACRRTGVAVGDFQIALLRATGQLEKLNGLMSAMRSDENAEAMLQSDLTDYDHILLGSMHITI
jgi:hypothetical protein